MVLPSSKLECHMIFLLLNNGSTGKPLLSAHTSALPQGHKAARMDCLPFTLGNQPANPAHMSADVASTCHDDPTESQT
eukprot:857750-Amphidinium_carterae.1